MKRKKEKGVRVPNTGIKGVLDDVTIKYIKISPKRSNFPDLLTNTSECNLDGLLERITILNQDLGLYVSDLRMMQEIPKSNKHAYDASMVSSREIYLTNIHETLSIHMQEFIDRSKDATLSELVAMRDVYRGTLRKKMNSVNRNLTPEKLILQKKIIVLNQMINGC